ncbi:MAG: Ig-like domain-containing protein [Micropruina sp.]|nr:Ig-like domain-containing protein [Micropruina sp.]
MAFVLGITGGIAPASSTPLPTKLQPPDSSSNVAPSTVAPDVAYTTSTGSRVEFYTSVGNLDNDVDWRQTNEFAYLVKSVPKNEYIRASIYNAYWDGRHADIDPATGKYAIYDPNNLPETDIFGVTQAFRDAINQYSSPADVSKYIQTIGNTYTINDALNNGSSLADLLKKAGVLQLCPYGNGSCISRVPGAIFHSKFALFSKAKDSTGKLWSNVIWITSANLNGASGGKKSNSGIVIFGDELGYNNLLDTYWTPVKNAQGTAAFTNAARNGLGATSNEFLFLLSPRTVDFEGDYLAARTNAKLGGKKSSCKVYASHSLFSSARKPVMNAMVALQKDGCTVKVLAGPPTVQDITDTYFSMSESLRKLISNFVFGNVHDKTISMSYTLAGKKYSAMFVGSANLNGTSLSGDDPSVRVTNATATAASEEHSEYLYKLTKLGTNVIPVVSVSLNQSDLAVMEESTATLKATLLPTNATQKGIGWKSSNPAVATVDPSGVVTGVSVGTTTITATSVQGRTSASATVTVTPAAAKYNDFDDDGQVDQAFIDPGTSTERGSVEVRYGNGRTQTISPSDEGFHESNTNRYTNWVIKDINSDGYADLVLGAPALNGASGTGTGRVYLLYGSAEGLRSDTIDEITSPVTPADDATPDQLGSFGSALGAINNPLPVLLIGEPKGKTSTTSGGLVHVIRLDAAGERSSTSTISQSTGGVPGADEAGDGFGSAIGASGTIAVIGIPGEDVGSKSDSGSAIVLRFNSSGGFSASGYTQDSAGVPDSVEAGDRFGEVITKDGTMVLVGIPHEDVGSDKDAGSIQPFTVTSTSIKWLSARSQDSAGVPGSTESGDLFGSSVAIMRQCAGQQSFVVGVPGEDIGSRTDLGVVNLLPTTPSSKCPIREYTSGTTALGDQAFTGMMTPVAAVPLRRPGAALDELLIATRRQDGAAQVIRLASPFTTAAARTTVNGASSPVGPLQ